MTRRLYHDDAMLRRFDATVTAILDLGGQPAVVLDETAFYPEAGGQLGDHGTLGDATVIDTREVDGAIAHLITGAVPAPGARLTGELDWTRRRQHMAQHTAQHLLSGALLDRAAAATASARLGESALTIDVARDRIPEPELAAAEQLANDLIDDDLPIRAWFPPAAELATLRLRRDPKVDADIRVVAIGDFDLSPCGGTHCARTSQLGVVRIIATERYKGLTRITFTAARRARVELFARDAVVRGLAAQFSCAPGEVPVAIDKLRRGAEATAAELTTVKGKLATMILATLPADGAVVAELPGDHELLRTIAAKLVAAGRDAILSATDEAGTMVVIARAAGSGLDCGALWKHLAAHAGGRGGGNAARAEGRLTSPIADWPALVAAAQP